LIVFICRLFKFALPLPPFPTCNTSEPRSARILEACDNLKQFPERGRPGLVAGTREITIIWPYVIVYRFSASIVEILRVWHGKQSR
jgi:plasmid stabilization system protein ParE